MCACGADGCSGGWIGRYICPTAYPFAIHHLLLADDSLQPLQDRSLTVFIGDLLADQISDIKGVDHLLAKGGDAGRMNIER